MWLVSFLIMSAAYSYVRQIRSEFDDILLNHARSSGASVYEQTKITSLSFSSSDPSQPVSASWTHTTKDGEKTSGTTTFGHLIDASGRAGIMSTGYLKNRHFNTSLKNIAVWGYWKGTSSYGVGTRREGAPFFEALTSEDDFNYLFTSMTSSRRVWRLGMVHPSQQWDDISRCCNEPGHLQELVS
jgi:hypothetical protein